MTAATYGRFGFYVSRRSASEALISFGRVPWLGIAVLAVGPLAFTATWPVRRFGG